MPPNPKYSLPEIERRWLVDLARIGPLDGVPFRLIEDLYLTGTRLRLRKASNPEGDASYKFGIKYGHVSRLQRTITNLYLEEHEYEALATLGGQRIRKRRYAVAGGSLNVFDEPAETAAHFEVEFSSESEAAAYVPPAFVTDEIT